MSGHVRGRRGCPVGVSAGFSTKPIREIDVPAPEPFELPEPEPAPVEEPEKEPVPA